METKKAFITKSPFCLYLSADFGYCLKVMSNKNNGSNRVYTRTGDKGTTSLVAGARVLKNNIRIEAYGTVDELNAVLGIARRELQELKPGHRVQALKDVAQIDQDIERIQNELFVVGSRLACEEIKTLSTLPPLPLDSVPYLETRMDEMSAQLKPLKEFILPGGGKTAGFFHLARTICRRAERNLVNLDTHSPIEPLLIEYLNRLSDYLFVLARFCNFIEGISEPTWKK